jgi:hypothetical protein
LDDTADNAFVLVWVLAENVANDDGGLLDNVRDLSINQIEESVDALPRGRLDLDR